MFCSKCGIQNLAGAKFCAECGNKLKRPLLSFHPRSAVLIANKKNHAPFSLLFIGLALIVICSVIGAVIFILHKNAQDKEQDDILKQNLITVSAEAERYFNTHENSYAGLCLDLQQHSTIEQTFNICKESEAAYAIAAPLKNGSYFCVDSRGNTLKLETILEDEQTSCTPVEPLSADAELNAELKKNVEMASSTLPMTIDDETRLDSIFVTDDNKMNYRYTLVNYSVGEIEWNGFSKTLQPTLKDRYCNSPEGKYFRDKNVPVKSLYYDTFDLFIGEIEITNADCK